MTAFSRADRVGAKIQRVLSEILQTRVKDPRLAFVTITSVRMSPDIKLAKIYFSTGGDPERVPSALKGFEAGLGYIKRALAGELGLRYMPDLRFFFDDTFDTGCRINQLLKSLDVNGSDPSTT